MDGLTARGVGGLADGDLHHECRVDERAGAAGEAGEIDLLAVEPDLMIGTRLRQQVLAKLACKIECLGMSR